MADGRFFGMSPMRILIVFAIALGAIAAVNRFPTLKRVVGSNG